MSTRPPADSSRAKVWNDWIDFRSKWLLRRAAERNSWPSIPVWHLGPPHLGPMSRGAPHEHHFRVKLSCLFATACILGGCAAQHMDARPYARFESDMQPVAEDRAITPIMSIDG